MNSQNLRGGKKGEGGRKRDRRGGSYVVVYRVAENGYNNLTQGRVNLLMKT